MTQPEALYHLQQIDLTLIRSRKRLDEIAAALKDDQTVIAARLVVEKDQKTLAPLRTRTRDLELEIQANLQKTETTDQRLYSGSVKNPKELQEMQQEIVALKKRRAELEDQLLEVMLAAEEAEAALADAQSALNSVTVAWEAQNRELLNERARLEQHILELQEQRKTALRNVSPANLKVYDSMKARKANQPVAVLQDLSCSVCGIEQTLAIAAEVRKGQTLTNCVNCGRVLVDGQVVSSK